MPVARPPPPDADDHRVLPAPLLNRVVDDGQVRRAEDAERGGEFLLGLTVARERAKHDVRHVDEHAQHRRREPWIPGPVAPPSFGRPERPGDEHDEAERDRGLGAGFGERVAPVGRRQEVRHRADEAGARAEYIAYAAGTWK